MNNEERIEIGKMLDTMGYRLDLYSRDFEAQIDGIVYMWNKEDPRILLTLLGEYRKGKEIKNKALNLLRQYEFIRIATESYPCDEVKRVFYDEWEDDIKSNDDLLCMLKSYNRPIYQWMEYGLGSGVGESKGDKLDRILCIMSRMVIRNHEINDQEPPDYW